MQVTTPIDSIADHQTDDLMLMITLMTNLYDDLPMAVLMPSLQLLLLLLLHLLLLMLQAILMAVHHGIEVILVSYDVYHYNVLRHHVNTSIYHMWSRNRILCVVVA